MEIIQTDLDFRVQKFSKNIPEYIIIHHALAKKCTIEDVHRWHLQRGMWGFGYHYFINKEGNVFRGREDSWNGAHCRQQGMNFKSLGICLEGCYQVYSDQTEKHVPQAQLSALIQLVKDRMEKYKIDVGRVKPHRFFSPEKLCPGEFFPWDEFIRRLAPQDINWEQEYKRIKAKYNSLVESLNDLISGHPLQE